MPVRKRSYHGPVEATVDVLSGRWKPLILWALRDGTLRFGQIEEDLSAYAESKVSTPLQTGTVTVAATCPHLPGPVSRCLWGKADEREPQRLPQGPQGKGAESRHPCFRAGGRGIRAARGCSRLPRKAAAERSRPHSRKRRGR